MFLVRCSVALTLLIFVSKASAKTSNQPQIVIVGAGLSGISAAVKLIENGFEDIKIIEAENRIGGRIFSVPFANGMIDLGAQWVHGETNNVIYDLMRDHFPFGDTGIEQTNPLFVSFNGQKMNQEQCRKLMRIFEEILEDYEEMKKFQGTLGDFVMTKFWSKVQFMQFTPRDLPEQMIGLMQKEVNVWNGTTSWFDISAKLNANSDVNTGNQYMTWLDKGFSTIFDYLTKKLPDPSKRIDVESRTVLGTKVTNILWKKHSWSRKESTKHLEIVLETGENLTADHVIFTPSLGVLKYNHSSLFTPPLPPWKINAIMNSGYGTLEKIFLEFEKPFWPTDKNVWVSYDFLWSHNDIDQLRGSDEGWVINIRSFTRVDAMPNVIEAIMAGDNMAEFELFTDEKVTKDCMWLLEKFLGKCLPHPIAMKRTKWLTNPNFFGTYSYQSYLAEANNVLPKDLARSIENEDKKPLILFAGEATDDKFPSNAHGAVRSGWRVAEEIMKFYN